MILFGALLVGLAIGFFLGVGWGAREALADQAEWNYKRMRDGRRLTP